MNSKILGLTNIYLRTVGYDTVASHWGEPKRTPDYNRLYFICDGEGFVSVDEQRYTPIKNQLVILPAGHEISFGTVSTHTYRKYWCHFDAKIGEQNLFDLFPLPSIVDAHDTSYIHALFDELFNYTQSDEASALFNAKAKVFELLSYYFTVSTKMGYSSHVEIKHHDPQITKIIHFIHDNLHLHLTNKMLSDELHFHPHHFIKYFKQSIGLSPMKYITQIKMDKAKKLLTDPAHSITSIGESLGYTTVYHFSKAFKQYIGHSPTEYRQQFLRR